MTKDMGGAEAPRHTAPSPSYGGPDRRQPDTIDRRASRRGGRRATDVLKRVAGFVHALLTEPPR
jgi:hypothetical protein